MKTVRPKRPSAPPPGLRLTPEEDFVYTRVDGNLTLGDLVALTGIAPPRVEQIVAKLAAQGAVTLESADASSGYLPDADSGPTLPHEAEQAPDSRRARSGQAAGLIPPEEGTTSFADFAAVLGLDPSKFVGAEVDRAAAVEQPMVRSRAASTATYPVEEPASPDPPDAGALPPEDEPAPEEVTEEEAAAAAEAREEAVVLREQDYRKAYEARFHALPVDARVALARTSHGADLMALCLDPDARVVAGLLENPTVALSHVRLVAFHHRTGVGLEMVTRRQEFLRDLLVERRLLRNPMAGDAVLSRIMASKRAFQAYKIAIDRDVPDLTRGKSRGYMRQKYQSAMPEERADLVLRTEGRCLIYMTGCAFDAKMTTILCGRPYNSVLFIQNLAKFSATPPALLAHLMKQPFVRKHAPLKKLLLQHPNMPGDVKRQQ
jgi:hypothetical protein